MGRDAEDWKIYSQNVQVAGLCHMEIGDVITWAGSLSSDAVVVSETYAHIISLSASETIFSEFWSFWGRSIPTKILLFGWLVWKGKILTWDSLKRRGFQGPGRCVLCCLAEETVHIYFSHALLYWAYGSSSAFISLTLHGFHRTFWRQLFVGTNFLVCFNLCLFFF